MMLTLSGNLNTVSGQHSKLGQTMPHSLHFRPHSLRWTGCLGPGMACSSHLSVTAPGPTPGPTPPISAPNLYVLSNLDSQNGWPTDTSVKSHTNKGATATY